MYKRFVRRENYICRTGNKMIICRKQYLALLFEGNSFSILHFESKPNCFFRNARLLLQVHIAKIVCF